MTDSNSCPFLEVLDQGDTRLVAGTLGDGKGKDLLDRIPAEKRLEITALTAEDKVAVMLSQIHHASLARGIPVREVEKLALYYILKNPELRTPRQLRDLATDAVSRMDPSGDVLKYDDLFYSGNPRNQRFWAEHQVAAGELSEISLGILD